MTWTLGIDTSSFELGLGLYCDHTPVASFSRYITNSHAEHLGRCVEFMLADAEIAPADIGRIGIGIGPGSFTGLRIGIAFIKGFCFGRPCKVAALSSLEVAAAAAAAVQAGFTGTVRVAFDARRDELFTAAFTAESGELLRQTDDHLITAADFFAAAKPLDLLVTDSLGYAKSSLLKPLPVESPKIALDATTVQRGMAAARLAALRPESAESWISATDMLPRYLRGAAAEERFPAAAVGTEGVH